MREPAIIYASRGWPPGTLKGLISGGDTVACVEGRRAFGREPVAICESGQVKNPARTERRGRDWALLGTVADHRLGYGDVAGATSPLFEIGDNFFQGIQGGAESVIATILELLGVAVNRRRQRYR